MLETFKKELHKLANPEKAKILQGFFKTGKGQYGEGDIFLGITVPIQRKLVKKFFKDFKLEDIQILLNSDIHEERFCSIISLVEKYKVGNIDEKIEIYEFYLKNAKKMNNWDLVDLSAPNIVGDFLWNYGEYVIDFETSSLGGKEEFIGNSGFLFSLEGQKGEYELIDFSTGLKGQKMDSEINSEGRKNKEILYKLVKSDNLWERRIAVISTFYFIRKGDFEDILKISKLLLLDKHDLIHKACGWMLREVGKRDIEILRDFLNINYKTMPRTMLRYAIEKMNENERKYYLGK